MGLYWGYIRVVMGCVRVLLGLAWHGRYCRVADSGVVTYNK